MNDDEKEQNYELRIVIMKVKQKRRMKKLTKKESIMNEVVYDIMKMIRPLKKNCE